jgi:Xaa-Pro aminopeptidase
MAGKLIFIVKYEPIDPQLFIENRNRLSQLLPPNSIAVVNANDPAPTNGDGSLPMVVNADLFYLTGVEQEQSVLVLNPYAEDENLREILFLRESSPENELWEGHKLTRAEAQTLTGIKTIRWLPEFPGLFRRLMVAAEHVYLNINEHPRAVVEVETRDVRFIKETRRHYPLHDFRRLAPLMHQLRPVKSDREVALIQQACDITGKGFERVARFLKPGVTEFEVEAEFAHEFIRHGGAFAYNPIVASGLNACCLHYCANSGRCQPGELLLLDVASSYANYNSDLTRTLPVSGRFTRRQKQVYNAVLRVFRQCVKNLAPGKSQRQWQKEAEQCMEKELVDLKLISLRDLKQQNPDQPAVKKYFMHGIGHSLGLGVHDVTASGQSLAAGWVMTVEPGIYIPEEKFAVRLENDVLITPDGNVDLMAKIPIEADEIEDLMQKKRRVLK